MKWQKLVGLAISVSLLLMTSQISHAGFYSWFDENGKANFASNPEDVPEKYRAEAFGFDREEEEKDESGVPGYRTFSDVDYPGEVAMAKVVVERWLRKFYKPQKVKAQAWSRAIYCAGDECLIYCGYGVEDPYSAWGLEAKDQWFVLRNDRVVDVKPGSFY